MEIYCPKHTLQFLQEKFSRSNIVSLTTQEESNNEEKFLGKKTKKLKELDEFKSFEDHNFEMPTSSFNLVVDKFIEYVEKDCERLKKNESPLLGVESVSKLQDFMKKFVEIYKNYHPEVREMYEKLKGIKDH